MVLHTTPFRPRTAEPVEEKTDRPPAKPERPHDEGWARFREVVAAAIACFNGGDLPHAARLLDLAERWQLEQDLESSRARELRDRLSEKLDEGQLVRRTQDPDQRHLLVSILAFFPRFDCERLFAALRRETRRDRRRALLAILIAEGDLTRPLAIARLRNANNLASSQDEWYLRRNLLHLVRRIPPPADAPPTETLNIAIRYSRLGLPSTVIKEAVGLLGQIRDDRAEFALIGLLGEVTDMLASRDAYGETTGLESVAERISGALATFPTSRARRAIVDHAERVRLERGRPMKTLAALGRFDLSGDEATVDRLLGLIRRIRRCRAAGRLVPFLRRQDDDDLVPALEALGATPLPVVRRNLRLVARRFASQKGGQTAARLLADLERKASGA